MGQLIDGKWTQDALIKNEKDGKFVRKDSSFRNWVTPDGSAGPSGQGGFKAEKDRYHLYAAHPCPWAHRALIFLKLKELEDLIDVSYVSPHMKEHGWSFANDYPQTTEDKLFNSQYLHQVYTKADPKFTGRVTVPVLWDKHNETIVNNESSEVIRIFNSAFNDLTGNTLDFYPENLRAEIDAVNDWIYSEINNGVYKSGFATSQDAYEEAVTNLFKALDRVEDLLASGGPYLIGDTLTEADWRLFPTLIRFDLAYYGHFKCNVKHISGYPALSDYLRRLYEHPGIKETFEPELTKVHYYASHRGINPTGVVPAGPEDFLNP